MQNVFVENTDDTQNIQVEDASSVQYTIVVEEADDQEVIAKLDVEGPSNIVVEYIEGLSYDIVIENAIRSVEELGLPLPDDDGQLLAGDLDGTLYWVDPYLHPAFAPVQLKNIQAQVIDTLETNAEGHVINASLRYLVSADIPSIPISKVVGLQDEIGRIDQNLLDHFVADDHTQYALLDGRDGDILKIDDIQEFNLDAGVTIEGTKFTNGYYELDINTVGPPVNDEGLVWWNTLFKTINISTGLGPIMQAGQEQYIVMYNDTGEIIPNGKVMRPKAATFHGGEIYPTFELAKADVFSGAEGTIVITTMDIPIDSLGVVARFGRVGDLDMSDFSIGDGLYISADIAGDMTDIRPEFPNYSISMGGVLNNSDTEGVFITSITRDIFDTTLNFWNGVFRETIDFFVDSDGVTVTGSLMPANGHDDMTMMFSDGFTMFDTSPAAEIELTPGTDDNPQLNYVYIPKSTKVLTVSTSDWPTTIEHIRVASILLQSASATELDGALKNQNWNDHIEDTDTFQGHLSHITEKLRQFEAQWDTGVEGSVTIGAGDEVWVKNTSGVIYQLHRQLFPITDMTQYEIDAVSIGSSTFTISDDGDLTSTFPDGRCINIHNSTGNDGIYTVASTNYSAPNFVITVNETIDSAVVDGTIGDDIHIINDFTTPYSSYIDLSDITLDASGNSLNNTSFSIVVFGVMNKTGEPSHIFGNLPTDTYNKNFPEYAISDATNFSVYTIPKEFQGTGFLIARYTFVNSGGVWSLYDTEDLRGRIPNTTAGGGAGGTGVTTFLGLADVPNSYVSLAFQRANVGATALENVLAAAIGVGEFNDDGTYDTIGTAAGLISNHESTYNHVNYNTAYTHSQIVTGNPHNLNLSDIGESYASINYWNTATGGINYAGGNVGIGTTNPDGTLHVHTASAGSVTASGTANDLVVENNDHAGITILTPADKTGRLNFGDLNNDVASIRYDHSVNKMYFDVSGSTDLLTITGDSNVGINDSTPTHTLDVNGTGRFTGAFILDSTISLGGVNYTFPGADGTANYVLTTNGAGSLSWTIKSGGGTPGTGIISINGLNPTAQFIATGTGLAVSSSTATHTISAATNYFIPTDTQHTQWDTAYTHSQITTGNPHVISFLDLPDTPSSYASKPFYIPRVNAAQTALEFTLASDITYWHEQSDPAFGIFFQTSGASTSGVRAQFNNTTYAELHAASTNATLNLRGSTGGGDIGVLLRSNSTGYIYNDLAIGARDTSPSYTLDVTGTFGVSGNSTILGTLTSGNTKSLATQGYATTTEGLQIRWGTFSSTSDDPQTFSFSTPFSTACFVVVIDVPIGNTTAKGTSSFEVDRLNSVDGTILGNYIALGY